MKEWVEKFNPYDLYSKGHSKPDLKQLNPITMTSSLSSCLGKCLGNLLCRVLVMEVSLKYLVSASRALGRELLIDEGFAHPPVRNALLYPWLWARILVFGVGCSEITSNGM